MPARKAARSRSAAACGAPAASRAASTAPTTGGASGTTVTCSARKRGDHEVAEQRLAGEHAAAEYDVGRGDVEVVQRALHHQHDLAGEPFHERTRDRVAAPGSGDDGGSELPEPRRRDPAVMHGFPDGDSGPHAEMRAHEADERRRVATAVLRTGGVEQRVAPERLAAPNVAGLPTERRVTRDRAVRGPADAVAASATDDGDRVRAVAARTQQRERVVVDRRVAHPAARVDLRRELGDVSWHVRPAEEESAVRRGPLERDPVENRADDVDAAGGSAGAVRVAAGPAKVRDELAVALRDDDVGLRVAAVDADHTHGRKPLFFSIIRSASVSAISDCPTSGCASRARNTRSRPPRSAASSARSS